MWYNLCHCIKLKISLSYNVSLILIIYFILKETNNNEKRRVRFQFDINECKPMTGIFLVNLMLNNLKTQSQLFDSDINNKYIYDLFLYLNRSKVMLLS